MRRTVLVSILVAAGCSDPACACDELVPVEISGAITVDGQPYPGRVEVWDSRWSDTSGDDTRLDATQSSASGEYTIATEIRRGGCFTNSSQYYLRADVTGLVYRTTGEPLPWGGSESITCAATQVVDIEIEVPDWLTWPTPS